VGFVVLSKRWIVERTFGQLGRCRCLLKPSITSHPSLIQPAIIRLTARRANRAPARRREGNPEMRGIIPACGDIDS
jgi:hypothetical protein